MNHNSSTQTDSRLSNITPNAAVPPFPEAAPPLACAGRTPAEPTQQIHWQLPQEPRFHITRGGKRRDWRAEISLLAGSSALALLLLALIHWPHTAARVPSGAALSAADAITAPPFRPASVPSTSRASASMIATGASASPAIPIYSNAANAAPGLRYSHLPVPGCGTSAPALARSPYAPGNVLPAAPTALGPPVVRYSY